MGVHIKLGLFLCVCWLASSLTLNLGNAKGKKEFYKNLLSLNKIVKDADLDSYEIKLAKLKQRIVEKDPTFKKFKQLKLTQILTGKNTNWNTEKNDKVPHGEEQNTEMREVLFMGDILLTEEQLDNMLAKEEGGDRKKRQIATLPQFPKWTSTVSYYFDPAASWTTTEKATIETGFKFWHDNTCLNFVENAGATNKIRIYRGIGCFATLSMVGGTQGMSLGNGCVNPGTASHEMGHSLGIWHQQSRYDRNSSITVNWQHINDTAEDQYAEVTSAESTNLGMPYDYGSVMHYSDGGFSIGTGPTMTALNPFHQKNMGQREGPSFFDLLLVNTRYNCLGTCAALACQNNGYANPANCAKCICPSGTTGTLCNQIPPKTSSLACTGGAISATTSWQDLTMSIVLPYESGLPYESCYYWIDAPAGSVLEIDLISLQAYSSSTELEVKAQDLRFIGYKFARAGSGVINTDFSSTPIIVSETNRVILKFKSNWGNANFKMSYRYKTTGATTTKATTTTKSTTKATTTQASSCADVDANCAQWKIEGDCELGSEWREWAEENCAKTCGFCASAPTTTKATTKATTTQASACADNHGSCENFAGQGFCQESSEWYNFMQGSCARTCGFCPCEDTPGKACDNFKGQGFCEEGSEWYEWMGNNCARTCGFCPCINIIPDCDTYDQAICEEGNEWREWAEDNCAKQCGFC